MRAPLLRSKARRVPATRDRVDARKSLSNKGLVDVRKIDAMENRQPPPSHLTDPSGCVGAPLAPDPVLPHPATQGAGMEPDDERRAGLALDAPTGLLQDADDMVALSITECVALDPRDVVHAPR